jgi:DNA repair ATPase RecN
MNMEFYYDWKKAKEGIINDQAKRYENEVENQEKLQRLTKEYDLIEAAFDQLSDEQKEMLKNVPRTKEDWETFNEIGDDLNEKLEKLEELWVEIDRVADALPFDSEQLEKRFKQIAAELAQKYHLNN